LVLILVLNRGKYVQNIL
ncbi:hypothetical protein, partial [Plasmodium yoelii yoelii]